MAKETYGYTAPWYFYWKTLDGGGKRIINNSSNYIREIYYFWDTDEGEWKRSEGSWDYVRRVYDEEADDWEYVYINGDHPTVSGDGAKLTGTSKADDILNSGSKVTITSGKDKDTIENSGSNVTIDGGDGENLIRLTGGKDISIKGGKDTETFIIESYTHLTASIQSGEGKNVIKFLSSWEGYGGNFLSVSGGVNEVSTIQTTNNTLITGAGDDLITITSDYNSILSGGGTGADAADEDYILVSSGSNNTIHTGNGKDIVWIKDAAKNNTIHTGSQGDSIRSEGAYNSINSGYGDDTIENWGEHVTIQAGDQETTGGKNSVKNHVDNVTILGGNESDTITNYMGRGVSINGGAGKDVIKLYSTESVENLLAAALTPLLNVVKDFNLKKINNIIDIYNTVAKNIDGFEQISKLESSYKGKNQIEIRDRLKKISDETGELDEALEKAEEFLESAGYSTEEISALRKVTGKIQKVAGKAIKFFDNTEIVTGMMKEYADNKIWSTFGKELASDFEKIDGRLSFVAKKPIGTPTTVHGGKGNDKIYSDERKFHVYEYTAGDGNDTIFSWNLNDTLSITGGSYTGKIVKGDYVVTVGKGSVTFKNYTSRDRQQVIVGDSYERLPCQIEGQMLSGGYHVAEHSYNQPPTPPPEGINIDYSNLTVEENFSGEINLAKNYASYVTRVDASNAAGNVEIIGSDSTENIRAGKGNDNIGSSRSFTVIHSGAGKDIVSSSGDGNSINSGADNDVIVNVGNENSIDAGTGNDTIISDGKKNIFFVNDGGNKVIYGFGVKDTLRITDADGTFSTKNNGDDIIVTGDGVKITLAGAAGLRKVNIKASKITGRKIENSYANEMIQGTDKADTIDNSGDNVTISGGKGNDFVDSWAIGTAYVYSAGNDTLYGFNEDDTIVLGSVKINSSVRADGTVTLNLSNKKNLTLLNYWSDKINTVKSVKEVKAINIIRIRNGYSSASVKGSSGDDYIYNDGDSVTIDAGAGNDTIENGGSNVTISGGDGNDTFNTWGENTGLTIQGGAGNDYVHNNAHNSIIDTGDGDDTIGNWGENAHNNSINSGAGADDIDNNGSNVTIDAGAGDDTIYNTGYFGGGQNVSINSGEGSDSIYNYRDSVTIAGGADNDFINNSGDNVMFNYTAGDGNDRIEGFNETSTLQIGGGSGTYSTQQSGNDLIVTVGKGKITLADRANLDNLNIKGNKGLIVTDSIKSLITAASDIKVIDASSRTKAIKITGNALANTLSGGTKNDSIFGAAGNDSILGNAGNDKLYGQNGNDSLSGGKGNDSLWGGDGKDVFIYSAGNDVIADFTVGQDKIQIASGKISKTSLSGSDVLFTIGKGSLTVKNAKGKTISLIDSAGKASSTLVGAQALNNSNKASVTIAADMGAVDASARTKAIAITGNALANTISGGTKNDSIFGAAGNDSILGNAGNDKLFGDAGNDQLFGGNGNDSLWGGAGNDSLWGDVGKDTFIYTANEGTDKIFDYETGDMLKILNADSTDGSFKSSKYSGGDLTLTINGGGKIIFEDVASSTKFNINGYSYHISGSKLLKK